MIPQDAIAFLNSDDYESAGYWLAVKTAIEALEKQIPKKIKMPMDANYICPICGRRLSGVEDYCPWCGQKFEKR